MSIRDRIRGAVAGYRGEVQVTTRTRTKFVPQYEAGGAIVAAAEACVSLICGQLAPAPRRVERNGQAVDHPLNQLLVSPWPDGNAMDFWLFMLRCLLTKGNAYAIVRRSTRNGGRVLSLTPALEGGVSFDAQNRIKYTLTAIFEPYQPGQNNIQSELPASRVVAAHWYGYGENGQPVSQSPLRHAMSTTLQARINRLVLGMAGRASEAGPYWHFMSQALEQMQSATRAEDALQEAREAFADGAAQVRAPVLPPGLQGGALNAFAVGDLNIVEFLRWTVEDICRIYGIAPARIGQLSGGGAGVRTQVLQDQLTDFEATAIRPVAAMMDAALTRALLTAEEQVSGLEIKTETWPIGLGSMEDRANIADQLVARAPIMTPNEARARFFGLPPIEGGDELRESKGAAPTGDEG